ncbi:Fe-S cluster assembly ATPase SufC [Rhabdochlamydiaceae symbiont of Dictyostelium giganteum]|uniref:Fe-S cluster assembly ATPase SufC n=1 Tax=Rhabdochlamydiaceae symbiont of Dictyostelium giganteum TaxID=3342349 RepID=UPI003850E2CE
MLKITDLEVQIEGQPILKKFSLSMKPGEVHAIMGPNGAGKSTLAKVLAGHPEYEVTNGEVSFEGEDLLVLSPEERAQRGLFLSFQYPVEVPGLTNTQFLHSAYVACKGPISADDFATLLNDKMESMRIKSSFKTRNLNEGFSGGEKKKNELLQMAVLEPKLIILDEIDSGLDIDAMKDVAEGVKTLLDGKRSVLIVTHYQRLLDYIKPDYVHVAMDGKIVKTGDALLAQELEQAGYHVYQ